jgi:hypothetical protein
VEDLRDLLWRVGQLTSSWCGPRRTRRPGHTAGPIDHDPARTQMRKLIESTIVSLDGIVESPDR